MLKVIFQADKPEKLSGRKIKTKGSSLSGDSESGGLKTKKAFQESGTFLKSLNPAYKAKCDSFFIICGKPEIFKNIALKTEPDRLKILAKAKKNRLCFEKCGKKSAGIYGEKQ